MVKDIRDFCHAAVTQILAKFHTNITKLSQKRQRPVLGAPLALCLFCDKYVKKAHISEPFFAFILWLDTADHPPLALHRLYFFWFRG